MPDFSNAILGVTGAAGPFGRTVVETLLARGAKHIVAVTRSPDKLADLAAKGVTVRAGDFDDAKSLDAAFAGIDRLLIVSTDKIGVPGARFAQHKAAVEAARRAGVKHLVYTSIPTPYPSNRAQVADDHFWTEQAIIDSGLDWTFLRNSLYMDLTVGDAPRALASGQLFHAAGTGLRNLVSRADCAATAAGALLIAEGKSLHNVTGREALSLPEIAAILAKAGGKPIAAVAIPGEALIDGMVKGGLPENLAITFSAFDTDTARGYFAVTDNTVEHFAGHPPVTLAEFLVANPIPKTA